MHSKVYDTQQQIGRWPATNANVAATNKACLLLHFHCYEQLHEARLQGAAMNSLHDCTVK